MISNSKKAPLYLDCENSVAPQKKYWVCFAIIVQALINNTMKEKKEAEIGADSEIKVFKNAPETDINNGGLSLVMIVV